MSDDSAQAWVSLTDDSNQITVQVSAAGVPTVELGIGAKTALDAMRLGSELHLTVNRALSDYTSMKLAEYRKESATRRAEARHRGAGVGTVAERLDSLYERTLDTQASVRDLRSSATSHEPTTAGSRSQVWVEALHGVLSVVSVDEHFFASAAPGTLEQAINDVLREAVVPSARNDGPWAAVAKRHTGEQS